MEYTTIQIRKETRERLKKLRLTKRESYDEIINRLIEKCK
jgi:predicted CopG family antitoxin